MNPRVSENERVFVSKKEFLKRLSEDETVFMQDVLLPIFRKHKMGLVATGILTNVEECSFLNMQDIELIAIGETDNVYHALKECREKRCAVFLDFDGYDQEFCGGEIIERKKSVKSLYAFNIGLSNRIIHLSIPWDNFKVKGIRL